MTTERETYVAAGTLFGKQFLRLVRLGSYRLDAHMDGTLLVFTHLDRPGLIGFIGKTLGDEGVNIAQMNVGREHQGGEAIGVVNLDGVPTPTALDAVQKHPHILSLSVIKLPPRGALPAWLALWRLSLAIERASCLVVPSRAKNVRSNEDLLPLLTALKWNSEGLIPAIVQEVESGEVLMMAWMDQAALRKTLEVGQIHFYSRSRRSLWHKGATSGHVQVVVSIHVDCDADVLLVKVRQQGGACHEGYHSCFFRRVNEAGALEVVETPIFDAETVYAQDREPSRGNSPVTGVS